MYLLRHGQSAFNLHFNRTRIDPGIKDPPLTEEGIRQARAAGCALAGAGIAYIITSPYTRTLQTAAAVGEILGAPIGIDPLVRERFAFTCDIGSPRAALMSTWPGHDFATLDERWWPDAAEPEDQVIARAARFRAAMRADPNAARTLLVSHWGFLLALTGCSIDNGGWTAWDPHAQPPGAIDWS